MKTKTKRPTFSKAQISEVRWLQRNPCRFSNAREWHGRLELLLKSIAIRYVGRKGLDAGDMKSALNSQSSLEGIAWFRQFVKMLRLHRILRTKEKMIWGAWTKALRVNAPFLTVLPGKKFSAKVTVLKAPKKL